MKLQNIPLDQIVDNPWRDLKLYPIDDDHVADLRDSIKEHGFFASLKGRRRNGKIELGCGHSRIAAAKKAKLDTIPIFIDDLDDDAMLRLMTDENALQSGSNPGAIMNEVAAVTRRLIEALLGPSDNCPKVIAGLFNGAKGLETTRGALRNGNNVHRALGVDVIRPYLGQGNAERSHRAERQIREAISALKQAGRYDDIVSEALARHPQPVSDNPPSKGKAVTAPKPRRPRILDERCANLFPNEHQFHAFREAVTTAGAQKAIPVDQQYALAKNIMTSPPPKEGQSLRGATTKKQIGAPYIKVRVQAAVQEGLDKQRNIDKAEREVYLTEQREARIADELHSANASLRSLISAIARLIDLAEQCPDHPKIGGFSARLDTLVGAITQLRNKLK